MLFQVLSVWFAYFRNYVESMNTEFVKASTQKLTNARITTPQYAQH